MDANFAFRKTLIIASKKKSLRTLRGGCTMSLVFGSALLLAGAPLFATETSASSGVAALPRAYAKCPGVTSVPVTADAEQALPVAQVATLSCGEAVSLLSDSGAYTSRIRTSDGKEGYVAYMYLTREARPFRTKTETAVQPVRAIAQNSVVRWNAGAPGCDQFASNGRTVESVTANGVTVQVSLQDTGWKLRATVAVSNESGDKVYVLPALVTLDELKPGLRNLRQESPVTLAHKEANHQLMRTEYTAQPSPSAVAYRSGWTPTLTASAYRTPPEQDYLANSTEALPVKTLALKNVNLAPGQKTTGELWFARDTNARELSMRLSIGEVVTTFHFPSRRRNNDG